MPDFPSIQFVSAPSESATLRYDFNDRDATGRRAHPLGAGGLDLGVPSFSGEPEGVGFDYGYRQIRLTQRLEGSRALALAKMSLLAREVLRSTNWLRVQWESGSSPRYFKTFRGEPGALDLENSGVDVWDVTVPLVAEGFAYGPRETIPQFQIVQGPADLTSPTRYAMRYALPAIKGDAPTALRVTVTPGATLNAGLGAKWMIGCASGDSAMSDPVLDIGTGDVLTGGTVTTDANFFNGSHRAIAIGAGSGIVDRITGTVSPPPVGRYKVHVRCELENPSTTVTKTYMFSLGQQIIGSSFGTVYGAAVPQLVPVAQVSPSVTALFQGWVDLGEFSFPFGIDPPREAGLVVSPQLALKIGTADGTAGTVRLDAFKLIPVDGPTVRDTTLLKSKFSKSLLHQGFAGTYDGDSESYWSTNTTSSAFYEAVPELTGGFPVADPAADKNLLYVMAMDKSRPYDATTPITGLNAQSAVDVSYHPRYLYLGDDT